MPPACCCLGKSVADLYKIEIADMYSKKATPPASTT